MGSTPETRRARRAATRVTRLAEEASRAPLVHVTWRLFGSKGGLTVYATPLLVSLVSGVPTPVPRGTPLRGYGGGTEHGTTVPTPNAARDADLVHRILSEPPPPRETP